MNTKISLKKSAVILIDMQECFVNSREKRQIISGQISVIKFCAENNIPIMVFKFKNHYAGNICHDLTGELKNISWRNIFRLEKEKNDAFSNKALNFLLRITRKKTLLIMGVNAKACVLETSKTAVKKGYTVIIDKDLISGWGCKHDRAIQENWYRKNTIYINNCLSIFKL